MVHKDGTLVSHFIATWSLTAGHQGEDLRREDRISFPFFRQLDQDYTDSELIFKDELLQSEAVSAPKYPGSGKQSLQQQDTASILAVVEVRWY